MVQIVADNTEIEKVIQSLLDILVNAGCGFHSKLIIHEEGGGLSLKTTEPMENGKEIIRLPRTVLMPGDQYKVEIDLSKGAFVVSYPENSIATDLQRRVIDKMYEIYNLTNKVRLHEEYSFLLSLKNVPNLVEKLSEAREFAGPQYQEWISWLKGGPTQEQYKKIIYETYVKTRPLGYSDYVRESSVSMIMPVLDFMNHHWEGGSFTVSQGGARKGDLVMHTSQPFPGSAECYANYGIMDAFDSLVRYDFTDVTAPIVRSVPFELEGPDGRPIHIQSKVGFVYKKQLDKAMQDLRRYMPDISYKDDQMTVSHLMIPIGYSKFALVRVLNLILLAYSTHHAKELAASDAEAWKIKAQEQIIEKNQVWYKGVLDFIDKLPADQKESFGIRRVKDLTEHQLKAINSYQIQHSAPSREKTSAREQAQ